MFSRITSKFNECSANRDYFQLIYYYYHYYYYSKFTDNVGTGHIKTVNASSNVSTKS